MLPCLERYSGASAMKSSASFNKQWKRQLSLFYEPFSGKRTLRNQKIPSSKWWKMSYQARASLTIGSGAGSLKRCTMRMTIDFLRASWIKDSSLSKPKTTRTRAERNKSADGSALQAQHWWRDKISLAVDPWPAAWSKTNRWARKRPSLSSEFSSNVS
jgi:hypothetical protein